MPLVIGFCLVAAFVAIVFLVVLPSKDGGKKETKTKIVSAAGDAANVNAAAPTGQADPLPAQLMQNVVVRKDFATDSLTFKVGLGL